MVPVFLDESLALLSRTPAVLEALLRDLPESWVSATEGPDTWSPYDVVGHLIHAEKADWMERLAIILEHGPEKPFAAFDREAQFQQARLPLGTLLDEFRALRAGNLAQLRELRLTDAQLALQGTHPAFGLVTARQLLATWTAHDMAHLLQISRVMAKRYKHEVGPWAAYLSVMK